jgi:type VI secretion system secreted protein VgrG
MIGSISGSGPYPFSVSEDDFEASEAALFADDTDASLDQGFEASEAGSAAAIGSPDEGFEAREAPLGANEGPEATEAHPPTTSAHLGNAVDVIAAKSPTLQENLRKLDDQHWTITYGDAGEGSYTLRDTKTIVIDSSQKAYPALVVQTLAHETGHALYGKNAEISPKGLTRNQYIARNVNVNLKDEGEATLVNAQVRQEILDHGGPDVGIAGVQRADYRIIAARYPDAKDRDFARQQVGNIFADGEHPSTAPDKTYRQYYGQDLGAKYDVYQMLPKGGLFPW